MLKTGKSANRAPVRDKVLSVSAPNVFENPGRFGGKTAIVDAEGECSYALLDDMSRRAAGALLEIAGSQDLAERRVAFLVPKGREYAALKTGIWRAGGVSVPLCPDHPPAETARAVRDCDPFAVVCHPAFEPAARKICSGGGAVFALAGELLSAAPAPSLPDVDPSRRAMIIRTSGTTSAPKGVVTTHANINAQARAMISAWEWTEDDAVLNILPLHHLHGILNLLLCPLAVGATCEMADFDARAVWKRFERGGITVFMAVPTIYARLSDAWDAMDESEKKAAGDSCRAMRLMVSGSAPLTVGLISRWRDISGHTLLERYGMTETGMILSAPLRGERKPGFVGRPMPGVEAAVFNSGGEPAAAGEEGEIRVRGENVFLEYHNDPQATSEAFEDGWFKTGDIARTDGGGDFRILGRRSVDIIKTGGYKVSALEVESEILESPDVARCAVVGVEDEVWGQRVAAAIVPQPGRAFDGDGLRRRLKERLAPYKVPSLFEVVDELPENALGKVLKPEVSRIWEGGGGGGKGGAIDPASHFDRERAGAYDRRVRILIPAYDALQELAASLLGSVLAADARVLVAGAGTGNEAVSLATANPGWTVTGFDPAGEMVRIARAKVEKRGLGGRVRLIEGFADALGEGEIFDAATAILVMHFLPDDGSKDAFALEISKRLKPGAPFVLADLEGDPSSDGFAALMRAWRRRMRSLEVEADKVEETMTNIMKNVKFVPESRLREILENAGFEPPVKFFGGYLAGGYFAVKS